MAANSPISESAKQRSLRVALDYYRWASPILRTRFLLSLAAIAIATTYTCWLIVDRRAAREHSSPGLLAAAHATWDHHCEVCHHDFRPLRGDAVDLVGLFDKDAVARHTALDSACIKCHAGPEHHKNAKPGETATCAACHDDHDGRGASIVRPPDAQCTRCHADLASHRADSAYQKPIGNVTAFATGQPSPHPAFRSLEQSDPGNIKFNHWLHLQPGIAVADARKKMLLGDIEPPLQAAYKKFAAADGTIQLQCAACHQTENADGVPSTGDFMTPIAFEQHCRACHPLDVKLRDEAAPAKIPHGLQPQQLAIALNGLLFDADHPVPAPSEPTADETGALPLVPGKTLGQNLAQKIGADLLRQREKAAVAIQAKCDQCHYPGANATKEPGELPDVAPSNIPTVWLTHARFDHRAHRNVECRTCHIAAYAFEQRDKPQLISNESRPTPAGIAVARDDEQVMIANIESCLACHAPLQGGKGGARHDCAECHRYHGRDHASSELRPGGPLENSPDRKVGVTNRTIDVVRSEGPTHGASSDREHDPFRPSGPSRVLADAPKPRPYGPGYYISALRASEETTKASTPSVGISSCSAAGCHGDARAGAPAWRSAAATWIARDPHAQAYEVLWTFRAREMTRLLQPRDASSELPPLTDDQHFQALQQRCIGCHATPPAHDGAPTPTDYALGVHCESCHGPAARWLHTHYLKNFPRTSTTGFIDTKDLHQRAAICMPCHVGPNDSTGQPQVVDHDLIAAGHPRLSFEFHAYFQSLPAHWDRQRDEQASAGAFHFRAWLAGQSEQAEQSKTLTAYYEKNANPPRLDFALFDCSSCHHQFSSGQWRQSAPRADRQFGMPRPAVLSNDMHQDSDWNLPLAKRIHLTGSLLANLAQADSPRWDASVQAYLAARAISADISLESNGSAAPHIATLQAAIERFHQYISKDCFITGMAQPLAPTVYDSPKYFTSAELKQTLGPVIDSLNRLEAALGALPP